MQCVTQDKITRNWEPRVVCFIRRVRLVPKSFRIALIDWFLSISCHPAALVNSQMTNSLKCVQFAYRLMAVTFRQAHQLVWCLKTHICSSSPELIPWRIVNKRYIFWIAQWMTWRWQGKYHFWQNDKWTYHMHDNVQSPLLYWDKTKIWQPCWLVQMLFEPGNMLNRRISRVHIRAF